MKPKPSPEYLAAAAKLSAVTDAMPKCVKCGKLHFTKMNKCLACLNVEAMS